MNKCFVVNKENVGFYIHQSQGIRYFIKDKYDMVVLTQFEHDNFVKTGKMTNCINDCDIKVIEEFETNPICTILQFVKYTNESFRHI